MVFRLNSVSKKLSSACIPGPCRIVNGGMFPNVRDAADAPVKRTLVADEKHADGRLGLLLISAGGTENQTTTVVVERRLQPWSVISWTR